MKFEQALQEANSISDITILNEGFRRYKFNYKGTRPWYKIHDKRPFVLAIDDVYNVDKKGKSILGINMHYFDGSPDRRKLFRQINKVDDEAGYKAFDIRAFVDRDSAKRKRAYDAGIAEKRKARYDLFKNTFPQLLPHLRRYKYKGVSGLIKYYDDNPSDFYRSITRYPYHEGD